MLTSELRSSANANQGPRSSRINSRLTLAAALHQSTPSFVRGWTEEACLLPAHHVYQLPCAMPNQRPTLGRGRRTHGPVSRVLSGWRTTNQEPPGDEVFLGSGAHWTSGPVDHAMLTQEFQTGMRCMLLPIISSLRIWSFFFLKKTLSIIYLVVILSDCNADLLEVATGIWQRVQAIPGEEITHDFPHL